MKMILASTISKGIGYKGSLPFHVPEDLAYFKEQTLNQTVVMGRKTFESLPFEHGLPNRENIVVTGLSDSGTECNNTKFVSLEDALAYKNSWIIGGKTLYEQMLPCIDEIHWTIVKGEYECDTYVDLPLSDFYPEHTTCLSENAIVSIWKRKEELL